MNAPIALAWISCVGEKGGAETLMVECLRLLSRDRFRPHVIQLRPGPLTEVLREIGVTVHVLRQHRIRQVHRVAAAVLAIRRLVRRHDLQLVHSNGFRAHLYGGWAGVPEVWTTFTVEKDNWLNRAILKIPTRLVLPIVPRTDDFFRAAGLPTRLIWPAVNPRQLDQGTPRDQLARKYQLPPDARWVSMGARLQRYKGQIEFLQALASLPVSAPVHGVVIGGSLFGQESDYEKELKALVARLNLTGRVTFTGFIPDADVAGLLAASYVTLHPAHDEDFGLAVAEAQALGVPTIAFATVGPAAIIADGETGWLVPVGDQAALNQALGRALADPALVARLGGAARVRCRSRFSIEEHVRQTEEVYSAVLNSAGLSPQPPQ